MLSKVNFNQILILCKENFNNLRMKCNPLRCECGTYIFPQRFLTAFICFYAVVVLFSMRVALNLLINEMIPPQTGINISASEQCDVLEEQKTDNTTETHYDKVEIQSWSESEQSFIRGSFYIGYVISHIPIGILADLFGPRILLIACIAISSVFTLILPVLITASGNWALVGSSRILVGLGQGMAFPCVTALTTYWIPKRERGFLGILSVSGSQFGSVVGNLASAILAYWRGWKVPFYVLGVLGLASIIIIVLWIWNNPALHPFISESEKEMLLTEIPKPAKKYKVPVLAILTDKAICGLVLAEWAHTWIFFTFNTDLPKYFAQILRYNIKSNGLLTSIPSLGLWFVSLGCGKVCDWMHTKKNIRILTLRRWFTLSGNILPGIFVVLAGYCGCYKTLALICFVLSLSSKGLFYAGARINYLDITNHFGGMVFGVINGLGCITGVIQPYVLGFIAKDHKMSQWSVYFWLSFGVATVPSVAYYFMAEETRRKWDYLPEEELPPEYQEKNG